MVKGFGFYLDLLLIMGMGGLVFFFGMFWFSVIIVRIIIYVNVFIDVVKVSILGVEV